MPRAHDSRMTPSAPHAKTVSRLTADGAAAIPRA